MRINNNLMAMNAQRYLQINNANTQKSIEKLSSGYRINRAGDDAAGLAISEKMRAQIRGLDMASKNSSDAISLIQTTEGALNETHSILQRMRELAVQSSSDTNEDIDRNALQNEINELRTEITRIAEQTEFNEKTLLNGSLSAKLTGTLTNAANVGSVGIDSLGDLQDSGTVAVTQQITYAAESSGGAADGAFVSIDVNVAGATVTFTAEELSKGVYSKQATDAASGATYMVTLDSTKVAALTAGTGNGAGAESSADTLTVDDDSLTFQIGANQGQSMRLAINDMSATGLGITGVDISNAEGAGDAITVLNDAIKKVSAERAKLGANQNRLEHTINNLETSAENLQAAESRIRDVDMAAEVMTYTKNNILSQAATAMLAQANQAPQTVLQLLQ